jgi:hypothetical protein
LYVLCLLFAPLPAAYGGEIIVTWAGTAGDSLWITPLNWSPVSVPNNGSSNTFAVTIGPPGATVNLTGNISIDSLAMNSSTLGMGETDSLTLGAAASTLSSAQIIGGKFTSNGALALNDGTLVNSVLTNNGTVNVNGGVTLNGTVQNNAGAGINVNGGSVLFLETGGTYTNNGAIALNSATLVLDAGTGSSGSTVTLSGTGSLMLGASGQSLIGANNAGLTLVNGAGHTIEGAGTIGAGYAFNFVNNGTVLANQPAGLSIHPSITNTGLMEATAGNTLTLPGNSITNTSGTIQANGGTLILEGGTITNGSVQAINSGTLTAAGESMNGVALTVGSGSTASAAGSTITGGTVGVDHTSTLALNSGTQVNSVLTNNGTINVSGTVTLNSTVQNNAGAGINVSSGSALFLETGGAYTNNGTIALNSAALVLDAGTGSSGNTVTLSGSGSLTLGGSGQSIIGANDAGLTLVNGVGHTIEGAGTFGGEGYPFNFVNNGTVLANQPAGLSIHPSITNTGLMEATAGNTLTLTGNSIANTGGTIQADGGTLILQGSTITGGSVQAVNSGTLTATSESMNGVTLTVGSGSTASATGSTITGGTVGVDHSSTLALNGGTLVNSALTNNGAVNVNGTVTLNSTVQNNAGAGINVSSGSALFLETGGAYTNNGTIALNSAALVLDAGTGSSGNTVTLSGTGSLTLGGSGQSIIGANDAGLTLVNGAGHTIEGAGTIGGGDSFTFVNNGTVLTNGVQRLVFGSVNVQNNGTFDVGASSELALGTSSFGNYNSQTQTLDGGTYDIAGTFQFVGADIVTNQATLTLSGSGVIEDQSGQNGLRDFSDNGDQGQFSVLNGDTSESDGDFTNQGQVTIGAGSTMTVNGDYSQGSGGTLVAGTMTINGNFAQDSGGTLDIDLYDSSQYGQLAISGNAALGGTLDLTLLPGYQVQDRERFTIMTFSAYTGNFDTLNLPQYWEEILANNSLMLEYQTPEPSTWVVLAAGLFGLGWLRRRTNFLG